MALPALHRDFPDVDTHHEVTVDTHRNT